MSRFKIRISPADIWFSNYIRMRDRWKCQRCGKYFPEGVGRKYLQNSHFWGRGMMTTRFEPDNCVALCSGCHPYFEKDKAGVYRDFMIHRLGEARYKTLEVQARTPGKKPDEGMVVLWCKKAIAELNI